MKLQARRRNTLKPNKQSKMGEREKASARVEFRAALGVEVRGKCQKDKLKDTPHDRTYVMECFVAFGSLCAPFVCPLFFPLLPALLHFHLTPIFIHFYCANI